MSKYGYSRIYIQRKWSWENFNLRHCLELVVLLRMFPPSYVSQNTFQILEAAGQVCVTILFQFSSLFKILEYISSSSSLLFRRFCVRLRFFWQRNYSSKRKFSPNLQWISWKITFMKILSKCLTNDMSLDFRYRLRNPNILPLICRKWGSIQRFTRMERSLLN